MDLNQNINNVVATKLFTKKTTLGELNNKGTRNLGITRCDMEAKIAWLEKERMY